jgi:hypothetical protein
MKSNQCPLKIALTFALFLAFGVSSLVSAQEAKATQTDSKTETQPANQEASAIDEETQALYDKLAKYLTGTRWKGKFTVTGMDKDPTEEQYEITKAVKAEEGDYWNLIARIKYGKNDTTIPLPPLEIKWAGKSPVITVDKMVIPGMGTFDARVLIRKGKYAGTWAHDAVGGHLFGTITRIEDDKQKDEEPKDAANGSGKAP